ncbi:MAG TPA: NADH:flavin oxidoreductase [Minicystis sp.]|nr:NADH:flavin oxidoreductase [Minicystis sp.]
MADLLAPLDFKNGVRAKNRVWLAPMTNQQSHDDGTLSDEEARWLTMRADGGFGVVETCAAYVARDGKAWPGELGVDDDAGLPALSRLGASLRSRGALGVVQIFHGGLRASAALAGGEVWSASDGDGVRAATEADVARTIDAFRAAAVRSEQAGFAGVELHGAHGYLFTQFLSTVENRRTDAWGGPLEGRARFLREALRAVRGAVSPGFLVGVRLSPEDRGNARGLDLDESLTVASWLADDGADFLHLSLWEATENTKKRPAEHPVPLFRAALPRDVALVVAGNVWTPAEAQAVIDRGADAVALARAAIANPDWAARAGEPGWAPRRPPFSIAELEARGLTPRFIDYVRRWHFVAP